MNDMNRGQLTSQPAGPLLESLARCFGGRSVAHLESVTIQESHSGSMAQPFRNCRYQNHSGDGGNEKFRQKSHGCISSRMHIRDQMEDLGSRFDRDDLSCRALSRFRGGLTARIVLHHVRYIRFCAMHRHLRRFRLRIEPGDQGRLRWTFIFSMAGSAAVVGIVPFQAVAQSRCPK